MEEIKEDLSSEKEEIKETMPEPFKKPQPQLCLVGPRKGKGVNVRKVSQEKRLEETTQDITADLSPVKTESSPPQEISNVVQPTIKDEEVKDSGKEQEKDHLSSKKMPHLAPAQTLKETPIPYLEPKWSGIPEEPYSLDVIKEGAIVSHINLNKKSYHVFGRQRNCDVQMAHPTVSRYHSVLQYSVGTTEKPQGFYIYDLGSTHGTFLNKNRMRPEMFAPMKVGHQIKIGCSSRIYLLQGPPEDMEKESELTVTELKAQRDLRLKEREIAEIERKRREEEEKEKRENDGIDWGMGDDADEETDLSENPYAITTNEELYVDDPKKTLRGWFDREGHELEYDVEEKGPGQFLCRVEIPVEGARGGCMTAEALVKGKKKEAVVQCALEACRLLDRLGLLRQATHESRKRKAKNWEEDDFYDSDDDTFLDRTGAVEKKRQHRMQQAGKAEVQVENFESLSKKHTDVLERLSSTQTELDKALADLNASKRQDSNADDVDTLDSFMSNLNSKGCPDKKHISKLKVELSSLQKEEAQIRKLVNIARPANLPELVSPANVVGAQQVKDTDALKNKIMLGARRKTNLKHKVECKTNSKSDLSVKNEAKDTKVPEETDQSDSGKMGTSTLEPEETLTDTRSHEVDSEQRPVLGPARPSFVEDDNDDEAEDEDLDEDNDKNQKEIEKRKRKNRRRALQRNEKLLEKTKGSYDSADPNYSVWVPPTDQSGDGKTKLNEKLGY